ncbi:cyclase family protein [Salipiger mucosus]|uniref:Putative cyclase n=1 Tax=Salipiger mucosus DSM 16094 TaxID=1123237 RepID=S9R0V1_9RHOB|nr:cyclase family protein [Salipiger mucosus]EPX85548.1 putative cyclase [Salipiger mucosus DSM 16094]
MRHHAILAVCAAMTGTLASAQDADEAEGAAHADNPACAESPWGADDQIGAANRLSPELARTAAELVTEGEVYSLGAEISANTPAYGGRFFNLTVHETGQIGLPEGFASNKATFLDDMYLAYVGVGSQIDGLGHLGIDNVYYNCNEASDFAKSDGLTRLGIENVPNMVTRGVLLDMTEQLGSEVLDAGTAFGPEEIRAQAEAQGTELREGDVVLFHTGWLSLVGEDNERYLSGEPGLSPDGARFLAELGVIAVGADKYGVEAIPLPSGTVGEVHQIMLAENGIYLLENMNTANLAEDDVHEFMFVLGPTKVKGGVQALVNPTAIR